MESSKNVHIWKSLQKVPAGTMFVPLIIGAIITTICQGIFKFDLWSTLGNPMKDMFSSSGQMLIIGSMPLLPLLFLGFYGEAGFGRAQVMQIISLIIPFVLGMVLGNLDADIRKVFAGGNAIILPFLGFEFGSTINLIEAFRMIPQGLLLSVIYFIVVITPSYVFERRVLHRPGYASVASGSLAGVALVIPSMAAASNAAFAPYVNATVAVLAFVLAVTNILCPFMVKFILTKHPADEQRSNGSGSSGSSGDTPAHAHAG